VESNKEERLAGPSVRDDTRSNPALQTPTTGRPGLITFAAIMMFVVGGFHILLAMSEFARVAWVPSSLGTVPIIQALVFWGIVDLIIGFIALYAGGSILRGGTFGWIVGYTFATLGIIRWLFYIPVSPVLAVVIIVLDVLIIYGLAKHSDYSQDIRSASGFVE
jgi:hypothetical protein